MTNWKTYKINHVYPGSSKKRTILFDLGYKDEVHIDFKDKVEDHLLWTRILCVDTSPFDTWKKGDYIEIDNDETRYKSVYYVFNDTSIVRKVSSSNEIVSRNNNIPSISRNESRGIISVLNEAIDSDTKNEYEAKIHVDSSGKYSGFSLIGRRK